MRYYYLRLTKIIKNKQIRLTEFGKTVTIILDKQKIFSGTAEKYYS